MSKISEEFAEKRVGFGFTENQLVAGLIAAVAATFLATMFGEWYFAVGWTPFSFNTLNAVVWAQNYKSLSGFFPISTGTQLTPDFSYFLGGWAHYSQGIFFGLLFALLIYPNLPGPMKTGNNLLKGLIWGWTLFIVSSAYIMPLLYGFGYLFSAVGYTNLFYNFAWHSTYGFILGVFYNPRPKGVSASTSTAMGSTVASWGQIILGWIVILVGGYVSSSSHAAAAWGVIIGLIGLILATGPSFFKKLMKS